jgi:hypothetical protein
MYATPLGVSVAPHFSHMLFISRAISSLYFQSAQQIVQENVAEITQFLACEGWRVCVISQAFSEELCRN